jgi:hypothetical protein
MAIRFIPYEQIDPVKWDACIRDAPNGLIYATHTYLSTMATHWDALVLDDYAAVMPLTWRRKYGIYYLYQPFFTASLGLFGRDITAQLLQTFLDAVPKRFRYCDTYLNASNLFAAAGFDLYERVTYVLPLAADYDSLYKEYRDNIRRNIRRAEQVGCTIRRDFPVQEVIALAKTQTQQFAPVTADDFSRFEELYSLLHQKGKARTYGIRDARGELVASCVFFLDERRAYYILVGNHPNGRTIGASHALIDAFIRDYAGSGLLLDFEGSDLRNLAFFYSSFGAKEEKYAGLKFNRLPWWMRMVKK